MARHAVTVELHYSGAWHDHTAAVYTRDEIQITRGRQDEQADPTASSASLTFDNRDGTFNPRNPNSPLYGVAGRNTPIRIRLLDPDQDVTDTFSRTVANAWGTADSGQGYTVAWAGGGSAADFDVAGGEGTIVVGGANQFRIAYLVGPAIVDGEALLGPINLPAITPSGGTVEPAGIAFRRRDTTGAYYLARLEWTTADGITVKVFTPDNVQLVNMTIFTAAQWTPGEDLMMRVQWEGEAIRVRVWQADQSEPATWNVEVDDTTYLGAGGVGVRAGIASGNTNGSLTFGYGAFTVEAFHTRFVGEVASWRPRRNVDFNPDTGQGDAWTETTASGLLRRKRQGTPSEHSPLRRSIMSPAHAGLLAYWPLEDGSTAQQAASAIAGQPAMTPAGTVEFAAVEPWAFYGYSWGTKALPNMGGGSLTGAVPLGSSSPVAWALQWLDGESASDTTNPLARWATPGGTHLWWELHSTSSGPVTKVVAYDSAGAATTVVTVAASYSGVTWRVDAVQNGGNIDIRMWERENLLASGSVAGTLGRVTSVTLNPSRRALPDTDNGRAGHLTVWDTDGPYDYDSGATGIPLSDLADMAYWSFWGEDAATRLARLCTEDGVPFALVGAAADTAPMGTQLPGSFADLVALCERTDGGLLSESRATGGLTYRTRASRYNQTPVLALDFATDGVAPPLDPDLDDQLTRNDVTVQRVGGSTARAVQTTGPLNVQLPADDPDGVGRYDTQVDLNTATDDVLADHAGWRLNLGTVDDTRYPRLTVDLDAAPSLATTAGQVDVGDVVTIDNLDPDLVELVVLGYTETIGLYRRLITYNCTPARPWRVFVLDTDRLDTAGCVLNANQTSTGTNFDLDTQTGPLWSTVDEPWDLGAAGERVTVTVNNDSTNTQNMTVTRSVNGVVKAQTAGTDVALWHPPVLAL